jgi:hypothetical protein
VLPIAMTAEDIFNLLAAFWLAISAYKYATVTSTTFLCNLID